MDTSHHFNSHRVQTTFSRGGRPAKPMNHDTTKPSPLKITFTTKHALPITFISSSNTFYLCPDCLQLHEARFCSGRTERQWHVCAAHKHIDTDLLFDCADLAYFREAVLDAKLLDPNLYQAESPTPRPEVTNESQLDHYRRNKHFSASTSGPKSHDPPIFTNVKTATKLPAIPDNYPQSKFTYLHDELAGCSYCSCPKLVIVDNAAVQLRDEEKMTRVEMIKKDLEMLEHAYNTPHGGEAVAEPVVEAAKSTTKQSLPPSSVEVSEAFVEPHIPTVVHRTATASELDAAQNTLATLESDSEVDPSPSAMLSLQESLLGEYNRIKDQVSQPSHLKATFTRRCNGQFVNMFGEVLVRDAAAAAAAIVDGKDSTTENAENDSVTTTNNDGDADAKDDLEGAVRTLSDKHENKHDESKKAETAENPGSDSDTETGSTASSSTRVPSLVFNEHDSVKGGNKANQADDFKKASALLTVRFNPDAIDINVDSPADSHAKPSSNIETKPQNKSNPKSVCDDEQKPATPAHSPQAGPSSDPYLPTNTLFAREALWLEGHVSEEDFILTCWAINNPLVEGSEL